MLSLDLADDIVLRLRAGQPLTESQLQFARETPNGIWPRPLLAMLVGQISEAELLRVVDEYPYKMRDLALNDAWFYIGQKRLAQHDVPGAIAAMTWYKSHGIRSTSVHRHALAELQLIYGTDANFEAGKLAHDKKDYATALAKWLPSANAGLASAQVELAYIYYYQKGVPRDYQQALYWLRKAAAQSHPDAFNLLGEMYQTGRGVPSDNVIAMEWYKKAADLGDKVGQYKLANYLDKMPADKRDEAEIIRYYRLAAEQGDPDSAGKLARRYYDGKGAPQNYFIALLWATEASQTNNYEGLDVMADCFQNGYGVPKDTERYLATLRLAADKYSPVAQYRLAYAYQKGKDIAQDLSQAAYWYERSAKQGYQFAQINLGNLYFQGKGVAQDLTQAKIWFEQAAQVGPSDAQANAQYMLGRIYWFGHGMPKDPQLAYKYLRLSAEQDFLYAQESLANILNDKDNAMHNPVEATVWYQKVAAKHQEAANMGDADAQNELGDMYENGLGVKQDIAQAITLYQQSAKQAHYMGFISLSSLFAEGK
ncbi:MAG: sel1 repeat family protein, partial [Burkholderiales bacterium]|nr:sel1 repeat family protein [Burkholderiales bacterium]